MPGQRKTTPQPIPEDPPETTLGARIGALRRQQGLSQAALAAATGVTRSAVAQWETGRAAQGADHLARIAQVLGTTMEVLLHGTPRAPAALAGDELALVRLYRACSPAARATLLREARQFARAAAKPARPANV